MLGLVVGGLVVICLGGLVAYTPRCECGHRGCWHDPDFGQCFKCRCQKFKKEGK